MKRPPVKNKFQEEQSELFDNFVKNIKVLDLSSESTAEKIELSAVLDLISNPKSKRILDIGCGTGRVGLRLASKCKEVIGIDLSVRSINIANSTARKYKVNNFKAIATSLDNLSYANYFDCVIMVNFLHHINDVDDIFFNTRRVLKKNGTCIIFEMNSLNPLFPFFLLWIRSFRSHFNKEYFRGNIFSLRRVLNRNGFVVERIKKYAFLPTSLYNRSQIFRKINELLNRIPIIKEFCAFHIIKCSPA